MGNIIWKRDGSIYVTQYCRFCEPSVGLFRSVTRSGRIRRKKNQRIKKRTNFKLPAELIKKTAAYILWIIQGQWYLTH